MRPAAYCTMENYTDFSDIQQSYLKLTDADQNTHFLQNDTPSVSNPDILQELNSLPTGSHQTIFNSTFSRGASISELPVDQQDATYNSYLNQYPSNTNLSHQGHVNYTPVDNDDTFSYLNNSRDHSVGDLSFFSALPSYNMATETPAIVAPIGPANTAGNRPKLRCSVPECSQDRDFPSESALRKHEAKHSKPYICQVSNCKHTRFGDKGGLDRHNREVHGSQTHFCPITSCKRHVRGFPRKYNRLDHMRRCHSSLAQNLASPLMLRQQSYTSDEVSGQHEFYVGGLSPEMVTGGGGRLKEKLAKLYKMREEIEADIEALKRSLDLLGENSSL